MIPLSFLPPSLLGVGGLLLGLESGQFPLVIVPECSLYDDDRPDVNLDPSFHKDRNPRGVEDVWMELLVLSFCYLETQCNTPIYIGSYMVISMLLLKSYIMFKGAVGMLLG